MKQVVGVTTPSALTKIKRQLLLMDQIAIIHDPKEDWDFRAKNPSLAADLDWLTEHEEIFKADSSLNLETGLDDLRFENGKVLIKPSANPGIFRFQLGRSRVVSSGESRFTVRHMLEALDDISCRIECQTLRDRKGVEAVSLFLPSSISASGSINTTLEAINSVVINALPEPDDSTPLEQIIEFKRNSLAKSKLFELRRWMSKLTSSTISVNEMTQELEWLIHQYEEHMRLHRLKINKGTLETFVTVTADMAENLIKLKLGNLARLPFLITERKVALLEAERNAPGREVAYIWHAYDNFAKSSIQ